LPLSAAYRSEIEQAANRNGFPAEPAMRGDWLLLKSPFTRHELLAGHDGGRFLVATFSRAIAEEAERDWPSAAVAPSGTVAAFAASSSLKLHGLVQRLFQLARSLPPEPLAEFEAKTRDLPRSTEAERLVVMRIGQDVFRDALMDYWGACCPLTGITDPALLRASHIVPWAECSDAQRLDVHNGLLLSALWDAAFDQGLVSFADDGTPLASPRLSDLARGVLGVDTAPPLRGLQGAHRANMAIHRARHGY
jgi:hypothetical protein